MLYTRLNTVKDWIEFIVKNFQSHRIYFGHGFDNPRDEAIYLLLHVLRLKIPTSIFENQLVLKYQLTNKEKKNILKAINLRILMKKPIAYITNESWFAGLPFYVNKNVLIPRSPLVEIILQKFDPWIKNEKIKILDIGTGCGCLAIIASLTFPQAQVDAIDISSEALKIAAINCKKYKVDNRIRLIKSNLFQNIIKNRNKYDVIISNPPYVGSIEMKQLPKEYYYEPKKALYAGSRGDEIISQLIKKSAYYLSKNGILITEVGNSMNKVIKKYQHLPFIWLEFSCGESEAFLLTRKQLLSN